MAAKGEPKTGGRKKGSRNKLSNNIRMMVLEALDQAGGVKYLVEQSEDNPTAFMALVGKIIPAELKADVNGAENITVAVHFGRDD